MALNAFWKRALIECCCKKGEEGGVKELLHARVGIIHCGGYDYIYIYIYMKKSDAKLRKRQVKILIIQLKDFF